MAKISKELEDKINEFQVLQGQMQMLSTQRQQSKLQGDEMQESLKLLETVAGKVFRFSGTLFLESSKEDARKDVEDRMELLKVRDSALNKQEERVKKRLEDLRKEIESFAGLGGN
ncbi:MAG: prefoldin subunit beta [Candidatus Micrarchaeota archaeon]